MQEKTGFEKSQKRQNEGGRVEVIAKYFLLIMALSFIGWTYEVIVNFFLMGRFYNSGFMTMPFCPIYGCSLVLTYFLLGTPDEGRGILKNVVNPYARYSTYFVFAFLIPTAAELLVGFFFDVFFDTWLWSYSGMPLNFKGYVSLPVSLAWMVMTFAFMKWLFTPIKRLIFKIPKKLAITLAVAVGIAVATDMTISYIKL